MTDTPKRIGPTQPAGTTTVLYTVPTATTFILTHIHLVNTDAADQTINLAIGSAATAALRLLSTKTLTGGGGTYDADVWIPLLAAETLQSLQSSATAITATCSGVEVT